MPVKQAGAINPPGVFYTTSSGYPCEEQPPGHGRRACTSCRARRLRCTKAAGSPGASRGAQRPPCSAETKQRLIMVPEAAVTPVGEVVIPPAVPEEQVLEQGTEQRMDPTIDQKTFNAMLHQVISRVQHSRSSAWGAVVEKHQFDDAQLRELSAMSPQMLWQQLAKDFPAMGNGQRHILWEALMEYFRPVWAPVTPVGEVVFPPAVPEEQFLEQGTEQRMDPTIDQKTFNAMLHQVISRVQHSRSSAWGAVVEKHQFDDAQLRELSAMSSQMLWQQLAKDFPAMGNGQRHILWEALMECFRLDLD
ncbi:hypothetical protein C8R43DRAFT_942842 [Mycena crocata]|nr:hypothetical protein C8R43DRAFT_942842 [Mycena crocata]